MQAVILAAGRGKRMQHLGDTTPKPIIHVHERPLLAYKLEALPDVIDDIVLIIGYRGHQIIDRFGSSYAGRPITYVYQTTLNGTGGALKYAEDILKEKFMVLMGDDLYLGDDLAKLSEHPLALLAYEHEDAASFGVVTMNDDGHLLSVIERPHTVQKGLVNTGAYMLDHRFFDHAPVSLGNGEFGLPQTLARLAEEHPVRVLRANAWFPISTPEDIERAHTALSMFTNGSQDLPGYRPR